MITVTKIDCERAGERLSDFLGAARNEIETRFIRETVLVLSRENVESVECSVRLKVGEGGRFSGETRVNYF